MGVGTLAAFELHIGVGLAVAGALFFAMGWAAQVWVTTASRRLTLLAYLAPLLVGAAIGVPCEYMPERFGMPPSSGYAIGCGISLLATVALSHAFDQIGEHNLSVFCEC